LVKREAALKNPAASIEKKTVPSPPSLPLHRESKNAVLGTKTQVCGTALLQVPRKG